MTARDGQGGKTATPEAPAPPRQATLADVLDLEAQQIEAGTSPCGYSHGCHNDHPCDRVAGHETSSARSADMHAYRTPAGSWVQFNHCDDHDACDARRAELAAEQERLEREAADAKATEHGLIAQAVLDALMANPESLARALHPHLARLDREHKSSDH